MFTDKKKSIIKDAAWLENVSTVSKTGKSLSTILKLWQRCPIATLRNLGVKLPVFETPT